MSTYYYYFFIGLYLLWCVIWTKLIIHVFDVRMAAYKRIGENRPEIKKKYYEFGRWDHHNYQKLPKLLIGYALLPVIRVILMVIIFLTTYFSLRIILLGSDLEKPLPKWKRFL